MREDVWKGRDKKRKRKGKPTGAEAKSYREEEGERVNSCNVKWITVRVKEEEIRRETY